MLTARAAAEKAMPAMSTQLGELRAAASCSETLHTHWGVVAAASVIVDTGIIARSLKAAALQG